MSPDRFASLAAVLLLAVPLPVLAQSPALTLRPIVQGLAQAVAFVQDQSNPRVQYVVQQGGRIRVLVDGALQPFDFLDLSGVVLNQGERGLLGLAMPADYGTSGRAYVNFVDLEGNTVVARFLRSSANALQADPASRLDLRWSNGSRVIVQPYSNHNGGTMRFGPDGHLYIGMGDGGSGNDPQSNAQNPATLLGKMLRLDTHVALEQPEGFVAPADNPFRDGAPVAARPETWSFGWRNPWKFSFDDTRLGGTGAMLAGDVGQGAREEIDYEPPGAGGRNYGWRLREGSIAGGAGPTPPAAYTPLIEPIHDYPRTVGQSVTGGVVYRGTLLDPSYVGRYFFADFVARKVFSLALAVDPVTGDATASDVREHTLELGGTSALGNVAAIETDSFGEMYIVSYGGTILRIEPVDGDLDDDTLPDWWERRFGLDAGSASGDNGRDGDPDDDGRKNADEFAGGGHPRGFHERYLAEGATSPGFFDVSIDVANPGDTAATAVVQFLDSRGGVTSQSYPMPPRRRLSIDPKGQIRAASAEFSTLVESDRPLVVSRSMTWDVATRYGSHAEQAVSAPAPTWFLAEGATHSGFNLFYLLQNPNMQPARVQVRYLRPSPLAPITKQYSVAPTSRLTIWVNLEDPGLSSTDVSAAITELDGRDIVVERAMYLDAGGRTFGAGHDGMGVTAPATEWFLAEGATGDVFDLFVLIANPNAAAADVECRFLSTNGTVITRTFTVAGNSRQTVWVDREAPGLARAEVSTVVRSTNTVPIVVERVMWWPGDFATWHEGHVSHGATAAATRWALAEGAAAGRDGASTYVLVANVGTVGDTVTVEVLFEDRPPVSRAFAVAPNSRFTLDVAGLFPEVRERRFGVVVSSTRGQPIVVEGALYSDAQGVRWAAGSNLLATPLP